MLDDILNYVQLTGRVATSGQPTADQFAAIAGAGNRAVINLAMPDSDGALPNEGNLVTHYGMSYVHIPVPWQAPTADHLSNFIDVMRAFRDRPVWVHCAMNLRVSAFMYHYLAKVDQLPEDDCRSPIFAVWEPQMDTVWREFLVLDSSEVKALGRN